MKPFCQGVASIALVLDFVPGIVATWPECIRSPDHTGVKKARGATLIGIGAHHL